MTGIITKPTTSAKVRKGLSTMLLTCAAISLSEITSLNTAYAQEEARQFTAQTGEIVSQALELEKAGKTHPALNLLEDIINTPDNKGSELNAYERSTIYQMMGQYNYELDNPVKAQVAFQNAIEAGGLLPKEVEETHVIIAKLMIGNGQYREGSERLEAHVNSQPKPSSEHIELLVNAWLQAEDYPRALPWAEKWFNQASPKTRKHYDLLNFLLHNLDMQSRQADLVKEMIGRWPEDKALWSVWASMLSNGGREQDAFEVNKMLYLSGGLETEDELLKLIQYYSFYDMPYQAADIMERELKAQRVSQNPENLTFLSTLLRQARDYKRAIPVLETAARLSGEGKTYAAWGEALYNEGDCAASETAFNEAINRGYDAGKAWMLIASCRYDQTNTLDRLNCDMTDAQIEKASITKARGSAIEAFQQVPNGSRLQRDASKWIRFIDAEKEAFDRRCAFGGIQEVDLCYKDIKLAYAAIIFTGEFKLQDESCAKHKAAYDAEFRPRGSDTE